MKDKFGNFTQESPIIKINTILKNIRFNRKS